MNPPLPKLEQLELPNNSIFHYVSDNTADVGPRSDDYMFRHVTRPIPMMHVTELLSDKGMPRRISVPIESEIRRYHQLHRRFRRQINLNSALRDPAAPLVMNYGFLTNRFRYMRSMYAEYNRWYNIASTIWQTIGQLAAQSDRHQFIQIRLPKTLPGLTDLRIASESLIDGEVLSYASEGIKFALESADQEYLTEVGVSPYLLDSVAMEAMNQRTLKVFHSPETLMLLELWKWAGPMRHASLISNVDDKHLSRINLIFSESGRWFDVNLGVINNWRVATDEEVAANPDANQKGIDPVQLQRRLLRMSMSLMEVRSDVGPEVEQAANNEESVQNADAQVTQAAADAGEDPDEQYDAEKIDQEREETSTVYKLPSNPPKVDPTTGEAIIKADQSEKIEPINAEFELSETQLGEDIEPNPVEDAEIERDLQELDRLSRLQHQEQTRQEFNIADLNLNANEERPEDGIIKLLHQLADDGMVSAAEYRKFMELSKAPHKITSPDGQKSLNDYSIVQPHETKITESSTIKDIPTVLDKTMLKSTLLEFDQRYVQTLLERDVAAMILALQNAGICITSYTREEVHDVMGSSINYHVRVVPVQGAATTLFFKIPKIDEDGKYVANGVRYSIRKQRGALPIVKINDHQVGLTSYYGKVFISRSEKKVNDYGNWLRNQVMSQGLDNDNLIVTNVKPGDVFDNLFICPRLFSTMAMGFQGFTVDSPVFGKKLNFIFDHTKREALYGKDVIEKLDIDGARVCGQMEGGDYIVMLKDDSFAIRNLAADGSVTTMRMQVPSFEALLELEVRKAPVEFAEIEIFKRGIPIGFVLAFQMGLDNLIKLLKVNPRRVQAGGRLNLQPSEYAIAFSDETLIFDRHDRYAAMILAGFNEYHRVIRQYSVYDFDKRGVYLNVLEAGGRADLFLREIVLMNQLFVDPITRELLVEMHEPVKFQGLLLRSVEMLLHDQHPDELDPAFMRIKGYERIAGTVYTEMVGVIRTHNGRPGKSKYPLDLNPYRIWNAIQSDPAKNQVSDINPVENLKDIEAVTFSGKGGRGGRSMTKRTRVYHQNDMGTISESTKDSSDVAINTYLSADPQFNSLRGTSNRYVVGQTGATALLSTAALLSPGSDRDDQICY